MRVTVADTAEPIVIVDRSFQNASDYEVHHATPGVYPAVWTDIDGRHTTPDKAYYLSIAVRTTLVERGGTDRIFHATKQRRETPRTPSVYRTSVYAYTVRDAAGKTIIAPGVRLEAGVSLDKTAPPYASTRAVHCAHDEVTYRRGKALITAGRTVNLDHPGRAPQRHAHIPGDGGMGELPSVWIDHHCNCRLHTARNRRVRDFVREQHKHKSALAAAISAEIAAGATAHA